MKLALVLVGLVVGGLAVGGLAVYLLAAWAHRRGWIKSPRNSGSSSGVV
jgi:hypothetical protein